MTGKEKTVGMWITVGCVSVW